MSDAANAADLVAAIPAVLGTSFGHDLIVQALSVLAALVLLTAWPSRRFAAVGLALTLQARHSHAFAMEHGPLCGRTAPPCRRCLARRIAAAADPGARRPAGAQRRNAEALLKARHALRHRHRRNRLLPRLGSQRRYGRSDRHRLRLITSAQGRSLCRVARACSTAFASPRHR